MERVGSLSGLGSIVVPGQHPISSRYRIEIVQGVTDLAASGEALAEADAVQTIADAPSAHLVLATGDRVPIRIVGIDSSTGAVIFDADVGSVDYQLLV
jgi:hypothetical protein